MFLRERRDWFQSRWYRAKAYDKLWYRVSNNLFGIYKCTYRLHSLCRVACPNLDYSASNTVRVMVRIAIQSNPTTWFIGWLKITHTWIESICLQRHDTGVYMHLLYTPDCRQSLLRNSPCQLANRPTMWRSPGISTTIYSKKDIYWLVNKRQSIAIVYLYLVIECKLQNKVFWDNEVACVICVLWSWQP